MTTTHGQLWFPDDESEAQRDRDVSQIAGELRDFRNAAASSFNTMREDFADLRSHVDRGFAEMRCKLDGSAAGQEHIANLIQTLIDRDET